MNYSTKTPVLIIKFIFFIERPPFIKKTHLLHVSCSHILRIYAMTVFFPSFFVEYYFKLLDGDALSLLLFSFLDPLVKPLRSMLLKPLNSSVPFYLGQQYCLCYGTIFHWHHQMHFVFFLPTLNASVAKWHHDILIGCCSYLCCSYRCCWCCSYCHDCVRTKYFRP